MNGIQGDCPLCKNSLEIGEIVEIREKGATGINHASIERGDDIKVTAGSNVHKKCRMDYVNKKDIERFKKIQSKTHAPLKRVTRYAHISYDNKTNCLFCGDNVVQNSFSAHYEEYCHVSTDSFVDNQSFLIVNIGLMIGLSPCKLALNFLVESYLLQKLSIIARVISILEQTALYHYTTDSMGQMNQKDRKLEGQWTMIKNKHSKKCVLFLRQMRKNN